MIPITDLVISVGSLGGIALVIWGASSFVRASRDADTTTATKLGDHREKLDDHGTRLTKIETRMGE